MTKRIKAIFFKYRRVITYAVIGGINTAVDFTTFIALSRLLQLRVDYCQAIGYIAGLCCSFILNHSITFKDAEKGNTLYYIARFIIVNAISLTVGVYGIKQLTLYVDRYTAKILITFVTMAINYVGYKLFVFRVKEK